MRTLRPILVLATLILGVPAIGSEEIQLTNWPAPLFWQPGAGATSGGSETRMADAGKRQALALPSAPLPFVAIEPCRLIDTRTGSGFPPGYGPPSMLGGGAQRSFTITGQCGIPAGAVAVSFNFTVWGPPTRGDLRVFPAGGATPTVSTLNWEAGVLALANAAVVPLGAGGAITVQIDGAGTVDIFVDVNGYYAPQNSFCIGADCRTSWNGQDANSVTPLPRNCAPGQVPVATGSYQWKCGNICQTAGTADCGGTSCANILTDPNNCGGCATVCSSNHMATRTCGGGLCNGVCAAGWADCNGTKLADGCETDLSSSNANCGACGVGCPAGASCSSGACVCAAGLTKCGSVCANLQSDPNHCGTCATVCAVGAVCSAGVCSCPAGQTSCGGTCRNTQTDPNNCGACGTVCGGGRTCVSGICTCPAGLTSCGGTCRNLATDVNNCGACGVTCAAGHVCVAGACI